VRKALFPVILFSLFAVGCKKSVEPVDNSLIGKWSYVEYYYSIGGPGEWHDVSPHETIEFKTDGSFIPSPSFLNNTNRFEIIDSATVKFEPASTSSGYILMGYQIKTTERTLYLYPVDPICIEGCNNKFTR
jgi:hypothetical protein